MIFSDRQLQERCREQQQPLYLAFIHLTKAFDLVSRTGLFKLLEKIGCPPKLLSIIASFHVNMHGTVSFDGEISEPRLKVYQACVTSILLYGSETWIHYTRHKAKIEFIPSVLPQMNSGYICPASICSLARTTRVNTLPTMLKRETPR